MKVDFGLKDDISLLRDIAKGIVKVTIRKPANISEPPGWVPEMENCNGQLFTPQYLVYYGRNDYRTDFIPASQYIGRAWMIRASWCWYGSRSLQTILDSAYLKSQKSNIGVTKEQYYTSLKEDR